MELQWTILSDGVQKELAAIGEADILVGIPSFNNARTIGHVVRAAEAGLAKYFPDQKSIVVNSDGGSTDGTRDVARNASVDRDKILVRHTKSVFHKIATPYRGLPGKGSAFRTIFEIAQRLGVKACCVVDSDLRSITPEWIELLVKPVLESGYDYVAPYYHRHKYDGTITNTIVYPMTRALYGKRIRQPIGGDFGFSGKLAEFYLTKDVWETDVARYGIDIWMTTTAVANNFKVCQAFLGAKIHDAKDPGADLSAMLHQVVSSVFRLMEEYTTVWKDVEGSDPIPTYGFVYGVGLEPIAVNLEGMIEKFRLGVQELAGIYETLFSGELLAFLREASEKSGDDFVIPDSLWTEMLYQCSVACHRRVMSQEHILKSLTPLYLGKVASFVIEAWESTAEQLEERLEQLCLAYEEGKRVVNAVWE